MNKHFLIAGLCIIALPAMAQTPGRAHLDKLQVQQLMEQAKGVKACMANIDQKLMDEFKRKAQETDAEIKALCAAGKRSAAESRAKKFSDEMSQSKVMQETQNCTAGMLSELAAINPAQNRNQRAGHICDR